MIKKVVDQGKLIAIIGAVEDMAKGNNFITDQNLPMQVGVLRSDKGVVQNHIHKIRNRQSKSITNEFHMVVKGKVLVSLFNEDKLLVARSVLCPNMFCLLINGGHGYEILKDDTIMVEVKNGSFDGVEIDKEKF
jgi:hypothetical protein